MRPILEIQNVSKKFNINHENQSYLSFRDSLSTLFRKKNASKEEFFALKNINYNVEQGETLGIIGKNGAGKSTLLKILSKITPPTSGKIIGRGRIASLLEVGTGFHGELSGRENIFFNGSILGMKKLEIQKNFDAIVNFAEVEKFLDTPLKHYSSGMQLRLAFAVAAFLENEVLIIDEVLAVGDLEFQKKCMGKMKDISVQEGRTVLFVSHNIGALLNLCTKGIVLNGGVCEFQNTISAATNHYMNSVLQNTKIVDAEKPHLIYFNNFKDNPNEKITISSVEVLDEKGIPKTLIQTMDKFVLRINYNAKVAYQNASAEFQIKTMDGTKLIWLSTQPDNTFPLEIKIGESSIECVFEKFPLAAGTYIFSAGFAIPNIEWLLWNDDIAQINVFPKDIYNSGLAPAAERSLLAIEHYWRN